jgi:hypothetical protein
VRDGLAQVELKLIDTLPRKWANFFFKTSK